ncbi:hypothetical protein WA158_007046 [Blastocystis sp. Blastoise]
MSSVDINENSTFDENHISQNTIKEEKKNDNKERKHSWTDLTDEDEESRKLRIAQRTKQIQFGKNTLGYDRYCMKIEKHKRTKTDIWTPDVNEPISKRRFDGKIRKWRRELHDYDPKTPEEIEEVQQYLASKGIFRSKNIDVEEITDSKIEEAKTFENDDLWDEI